MTSFLHHIENQNLQESKVLGVAKIGQHPKIEMMQFPEQGTIKWNPESDCIKEHAIDEENAA